MRTNKLTLIGHSFKSSTRPALVHTLRCIINDPHICDVKQRSHREVAKSLGISESTWKRARGVGGEAHKVDIYYLLKFIALYAKDGGITFYNPNHIDHTCSQTDVESGHTENA